ncbi:hypothetical protein FRC11_010973, partial [Ceratobasidium sp. 423]
QKPVPPSSITSARARAAPTPARTNTLSPPQAKPRSSFPLASPSVKAADTWGSFENEAPAERTEPAKNMSLAGLSKEEKAAEMARRREERKQKIAQMKAQKQG